MLHQIRMLLFLNRFFYTKNVAMFSHRILIFILLYSLVGCTSTNTTHWRQLEKKEFVEKRIVYWGTGDADPSESFICKTQAKKLGFEYKFVLGCQVSKENGKAIDKHNKKVDKKLSKILGKDWLVNYRNRIDSVNILYAKIIDKIQQDKLLWDTLSPMLDTIKKSYSIYFLHESESPSRFVMNYSEADNSFNEGRVLYSLEVLLPNYMLKILQK